MAWGFGRVKAGYLPDDNTKTLNQALEALEKLLNQINVVAPLRQDDYHIWLDEIPAYLVGEDSSAAPVVQCPTSVTRKVVDNVRVDDYKVVVRTRDVSHPCGQILATSTKEYPIGVEVSNDVVVGVEIIDGDVYLKYQPISWPSGEKKGPSYCLINPPANCSSSSGSFTACITGCYTVLLNVEDGTCEECEQMLSSFVDMADQGDCTAKGTVDFAECLTPITFTLKDIGPTISLKIEYQGELLAWYTVADSKWQPGETNVLAKQFGDFFCDWPEQAIVEPCGPQSSSNSSSGSGQGAKAPKGGCVCDTSNVKGWRFKFPKAPKDLSCDYCHIFDCYWCLECSHDAANSVGAIYGGATGHDINAVDGACSGINPNDPPKRCQWSDNVKTRAPGWRFNQFCSDGVAEFVVVLRAGIGDSVWYLTVEDKNDPGYVIVRYAAFPPVDCVSQYTMHLVESDGFTCGTEEGGPPGAEGDWPASITLDPGEQPCNCPTGDCSNVCSNRDAWILDGFTDLHGDQCTTEQGFCVPLQLAGRCLTGGPCSWSTTISTLEWKCVTVEPGTTITITDKGDCWELSVDAAYSPGVTLNLAKYRGDKPVSPCSAPVIFTLSSVNNERCDTWPCTMKATPVVNQACVGCDKGDCTAGPSPGATYSVAVPAFTDRDCIDCVSFASAISGVDLVRGDTIDASLGVCQWLRQLPPANLCATGYGYSERLHYVAGDQKWYFDVRGVSTPWWSESAPVLLRWELSRATFNCGGSNAMSPTAATSANTKCFWANVTVAKV